MPTHYARAGAGARIVIDIADQDYGGRGYACADPEGYLWWFGSYDVAHGPRPVTATDRQAEIRCGIGGWVFPEWRGVFYPVGLPQREELAHASRALRCIEINGTFYRTPTAAQCAQWPRRRAGRLPLAMKAPRYLVQRRDPSSTVEAAAPFLQAAIALGDRLGPLLWQFDPRHPADADALDALMAQRRSSWKVPLQHALEVRNAAAHGSRTGRRRAATAWHW